MSKKDWSGLTNVFGNTGVNTQAKNIQKEPTYFDTNFKTFEKSFYGGYEVEADEPAIPDEEFEKELKMAELCEIALTDEPETCVPDSKEDDAFDEIAEFKKLNGIVDEKEIAKEQPTETKVKSVKVSKPKVVKEKVVKEKPQKQAVKEKEVKQQKPIKKEEPKKVEKPTKQLVVTKPRAPKKK